MTGESPLDTRLADLQRVTEVGFAKVDTEFAKVGGRLAVFEERDTAAGALEKERHAALERLNGRVDVLDGKVARAVGIAIGVSSTLSGVGILIGWALNHH